ncbi:MAG: rod shape-determining protein MreC [Nitriliruptoraceae bacterium]
MYQRRRSRIVLAALVLVALVLVTIDVRSGEGGLLNGARGLATQVFQPVQDGATMLLRPVGNAFTGAGDLFTLRSDNERLRDEVERLRERRRTLTDLERENDELRDLLAMRAQGSHETVPARVVSLSPSSFEWTVTIDVGRREGVARDMPVINGDGLVGRVVQVTNTSSRVLLAIDPSFFAAARSSRTGQIGTIEGRGSDPMVLRPLNPAADVAVGDEVVTSSYQGGVFPGGIPVGLVGDVGEPSARLVRELTVRPFVDFTRLHHVLVILSSPVQPVPPLEGTPGVDFDAPSGPRFLERDDTDATGDLIDGIFGPGASARAQDTGDAADDPDDADGAPGDDGEGGG